VTDQSIGRFQILSRLGRGGMADVYRCRLRGRGGFEEVVVVKRIRADRASDPDFIRMFLDEARLAAKLDHPNIVQVLEIDEDAGSPYIAMEHVDGPTLGQLVRRARSAGRLELGHLIRIIADICAGLHHAHGCTGDDGRPLEVVHRDVSPQNILVSRQGISKLLDFGVAKARGRLTETGSGVLKGKLGYLAPELFSGMVDQRADVFAAGVCLFEATTGQSPWGTAEADQVALLRNIMTGDYLRPSELVPDYPPALEDIVLSAIEPDPDRRCPSARELRDRLEELTRRPPFLSSLGAVRAWVGQLFPPGSADLTEAARELAEPARELCETAAERVTALSSWLARLQVPRRRAVLRASGDSAPRRR
jgi:serine/threonine protein kinase